ncbi:phosphoribosylformylglycinamidine synthase subunit PurL [Patescibacteria group bacterium]|nr:phosphoribosylformylglycinamidine synthase subunit PurL [Patescibacteria group bacterium]
MSKTFEFSLMSDEEIEKVLKENKIGLSIEEAKKVEKILGRAPTLTEAVIFGIQCSEHCAYRSTKKYLKTLPTDAPNVILGPVEDAGIVEIATIDGERYGLVMAHESHNHPSQIVPFEGAATGIGGIVRDVVCMGAKVIATLDPLRFGDIKKNNARRIAEGVISGIAGYGNPIGIPNLGGDVYFDESYDDNCLVNVAAYGLVKESSIIHSYAPDEAAEIGYDIIIVGKPTDNSGMGGAAFASIELDENDKEANKGAVQEPNPFLKRHLMVSTYDLARILKEKGYLSKVSFKDMGAGGNVCSTVEQIAKLGFGADIDLAKIHTGMEGLHPSVIACSETQERFAWVCHPDVTDLILDHYNKKWDLPSVAENARASKVGKVREGNYTIWFNGEKECDASAIDITEGIQYDRAVEPQEKDLHEPEIAEKETYNDDLLKLLASENIASRKPIYEKYDKQVRGDTIIESGEADAGVLAPLLGEDVPEKYKKIGIAFSVDGSARYGKISPYHQARNAVVESMRNVAAVGGYPLALTDCLNYGNPEKPTQMWEFVEGVRGIIDACEGIPLKSHPDYPTPIISGNVSLYNESKGSSISPSAIISCAGKIENSDKAQTMQLKNAGSAIYLLGKRKNELGGSEYYRLLGELGANVPNADLGEAKSQIYSMVDAVDAGFVLAAHDISEGGIATTLVEMALGGRADGNKGLNISLSACGEDGINSMQKLFSETGGFVVEVAKENRDKFKEICSRNGVKEIFEIGEVTSDGQILIENDGVDIVTISLEQAKNAWLNGLRDKL